MKRAFGNYRRLARGSLSCSSLWLGPGHLLYVKGNGVLVPFTEEYLRFELSRIEALAVIPTRTGTVLNFVSGVIALIAAAGATLALFKSADNPTLYYILAGAAAFVAVSALILLAINWLKGPTCLFSIQTPVRRENIRPLRRLRRARKVFAQLQREIEAAQPLAPSPHPPPSSHAPPPLPLETS